MKNAGAIGEFKNQRGLIMVALGILLVAWVPRAVHSQIQVLQIKDALQRPDAAGIRDAFCVVSMGADTTVRLVFANSAGSSADGQGWLARNPAGESLAYAQFIEHADGRSSAEVSRPGRNTVLIPAAHVVPAAERCGAGNIVKRIQLLPGGAEFMHGPYTDTVTVIASPA